VCVVSKEQIVLVDALSGNGCGVGIQQQLVLIEPQPYRRMVLSTNLVGIKLFRLQPVHEAVPDIPGLMPHLNDVGGRPVRFIEEKEKHLGGVLREESEIYPLPGERGPARIEPAWRQAAGRLVFKT
jgi:hypothetical protein